MIATHRTVQRNMKVRRSKMRDVEDTQMRHEDCDTAHNDVAELNQKLEALDDPRECVRLVQDQIRQRRDNGWNVPEDLTRLETQLMSVCVAESQGR